MQRMTVEYCDPDGRVTYAHTGLVDVVLSMLQRSKADIRVASNNIFIDEIYPNHINIYLQYSYSFMVVLSRKPICHYKMLKILL